MVIHISYLLKIFIDTGKFLYLENLVDQENIPGQLNKQISDK